MSWPAVRLGEVAEIQREGVDPATIVTRTSYVGLEHIESDGSFSGVLEIVSGDIASTKFKFSEKHILYGKLRPYLRKVARPNFSGICSTDILPIAPNNSISRDYLFHILRSEEMVSRAVMLSSGVNLPRLSPNLLLDFEFLLPPVKEQQRITAILDQAENLRRKRQEAISLLDRAYYAIFLDLFGCPVSNPKEWPTDTLRSDIADIASGLTKGRKLNGVPTRVVPYLAVSNVQERALNLETVKTIEATENEIRSYRLQRDDLLLTEGGDPDKLGRGTLWKDEIHECIHQNHIFRVRLISEEINPVFLIWLVGSQRGKKYFLKSAKQTTGIASINMTQLRNFPLLIPPLDLQRTFAARVAEIDKLKAAHRAHLAKLDELFASLQHRAFRGEL